MKKIDLTTPYLRKVLLTLKDGEKDFWSEDVIFFRRLVMAGFAACRVDGMRNEFVRLTDKGRQEVGG